MKHPVVLQVCKVYLPVKGGVQVIAERVSECLLGRFDCRVLTTSRSSFEKKVFNGVLVTAVKSWGDVLSLPVSPRFIFRLWRESGKADILVVHYPFPLADLAIALAGWLRLPPIIVYWHSDIVSQRLSRSLIRPMTLRMLARCRAIIVSSPKLIEHSAFLGAFKEKCHVIPFGYQRAGDAPCVADKGYFLFVGRHVPYKGIDVLIKAVAKNPVKVVVAGDGPLLESHKQLAKEEGVSQYIDFRTQINDDGLAQLMAECKALVLPSVLPSEAFALVQIEAMSYGKPVINTSLDSGVPWVARHDREGLTVAPRDDAALALAMQQLSEDPELLTRLGKGARRRYEKVFSMEKFKHATEDAFLDVLQQSGR